MTSLLGHVARHRRLILAGVLLLGAVLVLIAPRAADARASSQSVQVANAKKCAKGFVKKKKRCVCPRKKVRKGAKCVARNTVGGGTKVTPGGSGPLFTPPGRDLTGSEAANAIVPYLGNSTFTDCVPGFPACAYEVRYGHFSDATMYYCRLTPTSGSDIINGAQAFQIIGADMKADGSWGVTTQVASYGNTVYYTWSVSTAGVTNGRYWGPGRDPRVDAATDEIGPLQWVRGARSCSY